MKKKKRFCQGSWWKSLPKEELGGLAKLIALEDLTLLPLMSDESLKMKQARYLVLTPLNVTFINNTDSILLYEPSSTHISVLAFICLNYKQIFSSFKDVQFCIQDVEVCFLQCYRFVT